MANGSRHFLSLLYFLGTLVERELELDSRAMGGCHNLLCRSIAEGTIPVLF